MSSDKSIIKRKKFRWILEGIVSVLIILFITFLLVLDSIVKRQIIKEVDDASHGQYCLEIKDLDAKFWSGAIRMESVWLKPNPKYVERKNPGEKKIPDIKFYLDSVSISQIKWVEYLFNQKKLQIGDVKIVNPELIVKDEFGEKASIREGNKDFLDYLPGIVAAFTGSLQIESIHVVNGKINVSLYGEKFSIVQHARSVDLLLDEIRIDTVSEKRTLFSNKAYLTIKDYNLTSTDESYYVTIDKIAGKIHDSTLQFDKIHFFNKNDSLLNNYELKVNLARLSAGGVDFSNLFRSKKISFRLMNLKEPDVEFKNSEVAETKEKEEKEESNNDNEKSLLDEVAPFIANSFDVDTLSITNGKFLHKLKTPDNFLTQSAEDVSLYFTRVKVDSSIAHERLFVEDIDLKVKNYSFYDTKKVKVYVENLHASVADSLLDLRGINFSSKKKDTIQIKATSVTCKGINYLDIMDSKETKLSYLGINDPEVYVYLDEVIGNTISQGKNNNTINKIAQPLADFKIYSELIYINNGKFFQSFNTPKTRISHSASSVFVKIDNVNVTKNSLLEKNIFDEFKVDFRDYKINFQRGNYYVNIRKGRVESDKRKLTLDSIAISQLQSFRTYQRNFFRTEIKSVQLQNIDYNKLFQESKINSSFLIMDEMKLYISLDETQEDTSVNKQITPQIIIKKIPLPVTVDSIAVINSFLAFEDMATRETTGKLSLKDIQFNIKNFSNDTSCITPERPLFMRGEAYILGEALLEAKIKLPNLNDELDAEITANIQPVDGEVFNELLSLGGLQIRNGKLKESITKIHINNGIVCGELLFQYNDLKVELIDTNTFQRRNIHSRIANFMIQDSNPSKPGEEPDVVGLKGNFKENDNFIVFVWDVMKDGIISSIMKNRLFDKFVKR